MRERLLRFSPLRENETEVVLHLAIVGFHAGRTLEFRFGFIQIAQPAIYRSQKVVPFVILRMAFGVFLSRLQSIGVQADSR